MGARMTPAQAKKVSQKMSTATKALLSQVGSIGEEELARHFQVNKIAYEREFKFHPTKKYRADFFLPAFNLLIEVEGGTKGKSRHTSHDGYSKDLQKYNAAQLLGFSRLAYTTEQVRTGVAIQDIKQFIEIQMIKRGLFANGLSSVAVCEAVKELIKGEMV